MTSTAQWLIVAAPVLVMGARSPARAASTELCAQFDRECTEARAAGYRNAGICKVERLECPTDADARVPQASHKTRDEDQRDPKASAGRPLENGRSSHGITRLAA
jgi:hypothetical protein